MLVLRKCLNRLDEMGSKYCRYEVYGDEEDEMEMDA